VSSILQGLYVDHLVFRVRDLEATLCFYRKLFGEPLSQTEDSLMYLVGDTRLFFTLASERTVSPYDKEKLGLNHLAFGIRTSSALRRVIKHLNSCGLSHSGIKIDHYGSKEFVWLDDPNVFRLEFYCRPAPRAKISQLNPAERRERGD
jgi:catechol-2,3-dioxygenase